jgi:hypothetical protein
MIVTLTNITTNMSIQMNFNVVDQSSTQNSSKIKTLNLATFYEYVEQDI